MSTTLKTLRIYLNANLQFKLLLSGALTAWISGMFLQKIMLPLIVASAFNTIVDSQGQNLTFDVFQSRLILFVVLAFAAQALIDGGYLLCARLESKAAPRLANMVYDRLLKQSMHFHNNTFSGALVNQTNRFLGGYLTATDTFILSFTHLSALIVFSIAILSYYSVLLAAVILIWTILFVTVNVILNKRRIPYSRRKARSDTLLTATLADSISNVSAVKTFAAEKTEKQHFNRVAQNKAKHHLAFWRIGTRNDFLIGLMMSSLQILILIASIILVQKNSITIGALVLSQVYIAQIIGSLWGLSSIIRSLEQGLSDAGEMTEILDKDISVKDRSGASRLRIIDDTTIAFNNVDFTHDENQSALFSNLNLIVKTGEKVGLVGPSGGGKTTITKLLLRLNDIDNGTVSIGNQDIASVTQESLRKHIAYVPQEPLLFHRSLRENIAYGKQSAKLAEIEKAAHDAHADDFIDQLSDRYETLVGERGVKLSGGQRQRVAIARAMLKDAPILVLDEATSALDSESEVLIQDALWKLMEGRTAIVIAHRLSTIQKMDRIIVLDEGKIIEEGSHKDLIRKGGKYADLWKHQSGGFIEE